MRSLAEMIIRLKNNEERGIYFINDERDYSFLSYKKLFDRFLVKLYGMQKEGIKKGDCIFLLAENNQDMVEMFWACILGGIIPIPMAQYTNIEQIRKVIHIFTFLNECHIYTSEKYLNFFCNELITNQLEDFVMTIKKKVITKEFFDNVELKEAVIDPGIDDEIAFIQFSSGSTGEPKGVMISHNNLIANIDDILVRSKIKSEDIPLSWLPLNHNLGMIGFHLTPICKGLSLALMETSLFFRQPKVWMDACTKLKVTETSSPNFGYSYFLSKVSKDDVYDWDLSNLRIIYNGAEPINLEVVNTFCDFMERYNLNRKTMYLVYGMAEATLGITFPQPMEGIISLSVDRKYLSHGDHIRIINDDNLDAIKLGSCGTPLDKIQLKILNDNEEVADGIIGDIVLRGESITKGYYKNNEKTKEIFNSEGWMLTGDIGFVFEKNVFIVGRKKDMIIVNGVNYFSFDIERICEELELPFKTKFIACAVRDRNSNDEKVAIFVIYKGGMNEFVKVAVAIKNEVLIKMGIPVSYVIPTEDIHKTASGKIQRFVYANEFNSGKFDSIVKQLDGLLGTECDNTECDKEEKSLNDKIIGQVINIITEETQMEEIDLDKNLYEYGVNSIVLMNIYSRIEELIPGRINIYDMYTYSTINKLLKHILSNDEKHILKIDEDILDNLVVRATKLMVSLDSILYSTIAYVYMYTINMENISIIVQYGNGLYKTIEINSNNIKSVEELYVDFYNKINQIDKVKSIEIDGFNAIISTDYKKMELKIKSLPNEIIDRIINGIQKALSFELK